MDCHNCVERLENRLETGLDLHDCESLPLEGDAGTEDSSAEPTDSETSTKEITTADSESETKESESENTDLEPETEAEAAKAKESDSDAGGWTSQS